MFFSTAAYYRARFKAAKANSQTCKSAQTPEAKADFHLLGAREKYVLFHRDEKRTKIKEKAEEAIDQLVNDHTSNTTSESTPIADIQKILQRVFNTPQDQASNIEAIREAIKSNSVCGLTTCLSATGTYILAYLAYKADLNSAKNTQTLKSCIFSFFNNGDQKSIPLDESVLNDFVKSAPESAPTTAAAAAPTTAAAAATNSTTPITEANQHTSLASAYTTLSRSCRIIMRDCLTPMQDCLNRHQVVEPNAFWTNIQLISEMKSMITMAFFAPSFPFKKEAQDFLKIYFTHSMNYLNQLKEPKFEKDTFVEGFIFQIKTQPSPLTLSSEQEEEIRTFFDSIKLHKTTEEMLTQASTLADYFNQIASDQKNPETSSITKTAVAIMLFLHALKRRQNPAYSNFDNKTAGIKIKEIRDFLESIKKLDQTEIDKKIEEIQAFFDFILRSKQDSFESAKKALWKNAGELENAYDKQLQQLRTTSSSSSAV